MPLYADQSDPTRNPHFHRRWIESARHLAPDELDRLADSELFFGRTASAEHFSRRAEAIRSGLGGRRSASAEQHP